MDAEPAKVGDLGQTPNNFGKFRVRQGQRVATAEDYLMVRRIGGDSF